MKFKSIVKNCICSLVMLSLCITLLPLGVYAYDDDSDEIEYTQLTVNYVTSLTNVAWDNTRFSQSEEYLVDGGEHPTEYNYKFNLDYDAMVLIEVTSISTDSNFNGADISLDNSRILHKLNGTDSYKVMLKKGEHTLYYYNGNTKFGDSAAGEPISWSFRNNSWMIGVAAMPYDTTMVNTESKANAIPVAGGETSAKIGLTSENTSAYYTLTTDKDGYINIDVLYISGDTDHEVDVKLEDADGYPYIKGTAQSGKDVVLTADELCKAGVYYVTISGGLGNTGYVSISYSISTKEEIDKATNKIDKKSKKQLDMPKLTKIDTKKRVFKGTGKTGATLVLKYRGKTYKKKIKAKKWKIKIKTKIKDNTKAKIYQKKKGFKKSSVKSYTVRVTTIMRR